MLEEGKYRARAVKAALGLTNNGNEQVGVLFDLLDYPGDTITWYGNFANEMAFDISMKGLRTAGFIGTDIEDLSSLSRADVPEVTLVIEHHTYTYNGKTSAKVKFINGAGGLAMKNALTGQGAKSFAAQMKGKILAFDQSKGTRAPAVSAPPARTATTDTRAPWETGDDEAPPHDDADATSH